MNHKISSTLRCALASASLAIALCCLAPSKVAAQVIVHSVSSSSDFAGAIAAINADPTSDHRIEVTGAITMLEQVQAIEISGQLTVVGITPSAAIDGNGAYRPFFIEDGSVSIENLTLINGRANGGNGGDGAGGGLGAGAAMFVDTGASLRLKNVNFLGNTAQGGLGGASGLGAGGGGGLGGNGGNGTIGGGGGGGLYGNGGSSNPDLGGAGGGGQLKNGGDSSTFEGGGGGGTITPGSSSSSGGAGGDGAGDGGITSGVNGASGTTGGGGGGAYIANGGEGGTFGGGGGAGFGSNGGAGGIFGGGGGALLGDGGNGGQLGGGGGAGLLNGGAGGFGAGGGGANGDYFGTAGAGGFGGGSGGNAGGAPTYGGGGGGAAFGGALFAASGADIVIVDNVTFSANSATGGASQGDGTAGTADGNDLYLMSGVMTTFDISAGKSLNIAPAIGNNDGVNFGVGIMKEGEGTLTLSGNSNFVGGTFVDRGTLVVDGNLSGITNIIDRGTLTVNGALGGQTISDRGTININLGGILNGDTATVRGLVDVNGTINGDVYIADEGTLKGSGVINTSGNISNAVEVYGTIAPGNSIGTLHINGNYLQGVNGVYEVEVNAAGQSDKIEVLGAAYLTCGCGPGGGDVHVIAAPGNYAGRRVYTILTASNGIHDRFDAPTWTGFNPYTSVTLDYVGNDVLLIVSQFDLMSSARTFNQTNTGAALNNAILSTDPQLSSVFTSMTTMNDSELRNSLDQMSGELFGTLSSVGLQCTDNWLGSVGNRLRPNGGAVQAFGLVGANGRARDLRDDPFSQDNQDDSDELIQLVSFEQSSGASNSVPYRNIASNSTPRRAKPQNYGWVGGYGLGGQASSNGNAQGFDYGFGGTSFGVDRYVGQNTIVGLAGGYSASQVQTDSRAQSANVNSFQGGVYATRVVEDRYTYGILGYSHDDYATTRTLPANLTARGDFDGYQLSSYIESGLMRRVGAWNYQPSVGVQYIHLRQNGFTETGAGAAGLAVNAADDDSCRGSVGLRFTRPTPVSNVVLIPMLQARYGYEFCSVDRLVTANFSGITGNTFTTAGNQLGRNFGQYGVGLNAVITPTFGTYAGYDLITSDRAISHSGNGGLQFVW